MKTASEPSRCPLCGRHSALTFHHFIPRKVHRRSHYRKRYSREQLNRGIHICRQCHNGIHDRYDEMTLARQFAELEPLRSDPSLCRHFEWVSRQRIR